MAVIPDIPLSARVKKLRELYSAVELTNPLYDGFELALRLSGTLKARRYIDRAIRAFVIAGLLQSASNVDGGLDALLSTATSEQLEAMCDQAGV